LATSPVARAGFLSLILLSSGHFFIDLYSTALGAFQPLLIDKLGMTLTQAGILGGVMVFASSVTQPLYGFLSDRYHTKLFAALAPALAGLFISAFGWAPSFNWLLVMAVLGGTGISAFHPQASSRAIVGLPGNKGKWMAIFISSGSLGMAVGPTYFTAFLSHLGFHLTAWAAVPGVLCTILLLVLLPNVSKPEAQLRHKLDWAPIIKVWKPLSILYSTVFIRSIVQITFAQMLPLYLHRVRGYSLAGSSWALTLYLTSGAIGGFLGGHLSDRFGGRTVILISMLSCIPFLGLFFLTEGAVSLAGLAMAGLTLLFTIPVNVVMAQDLVPGQSGTISALMMGFAWGTAGMIFIPLTGLVADHFGLQVALGVLAFFPIIGFFLTLKLPKGL
jgi:FSR family fosmidomycin resistance protein-like MFS transporter